MSDSRVEGDVTVFDAAEPARIALDRLERLARVGHFSVEQDTYRSTWSRTMVEQFGFAVDAPPETVGDVTDRYHPEDRNMIVGHVMRAFDTGEGYAFHHRIVRPDGAVRHVWTRGEIETTDGRRRLVGVTFDVTDIRGAEIAMRNEARAHRFIADNTRDLITRTGADGALVYVSPSSRAITGYRPEELMGKVALFEHVHPEDLPQAYANLMQLFRERAKRQTVKLEYRFRHKDGHWIWLEANPRLVLDESGRVIECVDIARDVTQRKLDEAALAEARTLADAAAAAKSEFLANMSHELRTPLTSILGFSGLIGAGGGLSAEDAGHLRLVREAGAMLLAVVNDILEFSRLEAGAVRLTAEPFRLDALVCDAAEIVRHMAEEKGLRLEVDVGPAVCLSGDAARLRQMLMNLLGNAVRFTDAGTVRLSSAAMIDDARARVRLTVADTGIGVPAEQLDRLFDRFSQVDGSSSRRHGGTGLGLAITRRLCDLMGGRIGVESTVGAGSTFWIELEMPVAQERETAVASPRDAAGFARAPRVLVAEDHRMNQTLARTLLEHMGCVVDIASDGAEAVEAVQAAPYDLVFMDMQMPVMDGVAAARAIRALGGDFARLPIVAMTANVLPEQVALCRAAGMDDHVSKPIDVAALRAMLDRYLGEPEAAVAAEAA